MTSASNRYWECLECIRRLLLTSANVFISHVGVLVQLVVNLFIALLSVKIYTSFEPFIHYSDDFLSEISQWILVVSIILTIIMSQGIGSNADGDLTTTGVIFVALQLVFVLWTCAICFADLKSETTLVRVTNEITLGMMNRRTRESIALRTTVMRMSDLRCDSMPMEDAEDAGSVEMIENNPMHTSTTDKRLSTVQDPPDADFSSTSGL